MVKYLPYSYVVLKILDEKLNRKVLKHLCDNSIHQNQSELLIITNQSEVE